MVDNTALKRAKNTSNDEHYTQYSDIEAEMNAYIEYNPNVFRDKTILLPCDDPEWSNFTKYFASNFERFGLKKLISTSYAKGAGNKQITIFEMESPLYDAELHETHGKLFTLTRDTNGSGIIDTDDIELLGYLKGDGDFRSEEICKLRDEADFIITNPPFSLFNEFVDWIISAEKSFIIIGNINDATNLNIFPLIKNNVMWLGTSSPKSFVQPDGTIKSFGNTIWFTNVDHGLRHEELMLMTRANNLKYNRKLAKKFKENYCVDDYPKYDNYDAIEVPFIDAIPSDYDGLMGVPCSFLTHYNPKQFIIVGTVSAAGNKDSLNLNKDYSSYIGYRQDGTKNGRTGSTFGKVPVLEKDDGIHPYYEKDGRRVQALYPRIFIRAKKGGIGRAHV